MSHPTVKTRQKPTTVDIAKTVQKRLTESGSYRYYFQRISFEFTDDTIVLRGSLPTFYLKQVLQTVLHDIEGVSRIDDRVDVVSPTGLSSVRER